jgi:hypothetical protein
MIVGRKHQLTAKMPRTSKQELNRQDAKNINIRKHQRSG